MFSSAYFLRSKPALSALGFIWLSLPPLIIGEPNSVSGAAAVTADWTQDAPGVKHKITLEDLPAPYATKSASNSPREVG